MNKNIDLHSDISEPFSYKLGSIIHNALLYSLIAALVTLTLIQCNKPLLLFKVTVIKQVKFLCCFSVQHADVLKDIPILFLSIDFQGRKLIQILLFVLKNASGICICL